MRNLFLGPMGPARLWKQEGNSASVRDKTSEPGAGKECGLLHGEWEGHCVLGMLVAQFSEAQCGQSWEVVVGIADSWLYHLLVV